MNKHHLTLLAAPLALLLSACNPGPTISSSNGRISENDDRITISATGQLKAEISATGELTIDGKPVQTTDEQRELLLTYQREFNTITEQGLALGKRGAGIAGKAVGATIRGAMGGDKQKLKESIEAEARKLEQEALKLCSSLVVIHGVQEQLAYELPAFKPYATIDMRDVEDCQGSAGDTFDVSATEAATTI